MQRDRTCADRVSGYIHRMDRKWTKGIQNVLFHTGCNSAGFHFEHQRHLFSEHATNLRLRASSLRSLHAAFADNPELIFSRRLSTLYIIAYTLMTGCKHDISLGTGEFQSRLDEDPNYHGHLWYKRCINHSNESPRPNDGPTEPPLCTRDTRNNINPTRHLRDG
jgi:hypothetical protein